MNFISTQYDKIKTGLFGLHTNVEITTNQIKVEQLLSDLLLIQPTVVSSTKATIEDI